MGAVVAEFLSVIGPGITLPTNMQELIPYLITIFFGVVLVVAVIRIVEVIASAVCNFRRF